MAVSIKTTRFWHPFADMGSVSQSEFVIERGEGVWVFDTEGNRYLDGTASLWYANLGHGREDIANAVAEQMGKIAAYSTFGDFGNRPANELCERLAAVAPMDDARVFLTSGGGDSIDTAAKIARRHWVLQRASGAHAPDLAHAGLPRHARLRDEHRRDRGEHEQLGPADRRDLDRASSTRCEALEAEILRVGPDRVAAFFCEPVLGAGGVHPPPAGYIEGVADLCTEHGVLLIIDSVICGFGRLGTWFGIERWEDVRPDLITFAKGVTSGYLPLGGVVVSGAVAAPFFEAPGGPMLRHGATYAGHPSCCAAGNVVMEIYEREGILARGKDWRCRSRTRSARWPTIRRSPRCARGWACSARSSLPRRYWSRTPAPWRSSLRARATPGCWCGRCSGRLRFRPR